MKPSAHSLIDGHLLFLYVDRCLCLIQLMKHGTCCIVRRLLPINDLNKDIFFKGLNGVPIMPGCLKIKFISAVSA